MARAGLGAALLPMRRLVVCGAVGAVDRSLGLGRIEDARPLALHGAAVAARAAVVAELCTTTARHVIARDLLLDDGLR